jgi:hypothetical protein
MESEKQEQQEQEKSKEYNQATFAQNLKYSAKLDSVTKTATIRFQRA